MRIRELVSRVANLVPVSRCPACRRRVQPGAPLCEPCSTTLVELGPACPRCAETHDGPAPTLCGRCRVRPLPLTRIVAPHRHRGALVVALRRLELAPRPDIGRALAPLLAPPLAAAAATCDVAVPIPVDRRGRAGRGLGHADVLLRPALSDALPIARLCLHRHRTAGPGAGAPGGTRPAAFEATGLSGRRVLLFDDIVTTGATMADASRALLGAGASEVLGVCVARGVSGQGMDPAARCGSSEEEPRR